MELRVWNVEIYQEDGGHVSFMEIVVGYVPRMFLPLIAIAKAREQLENTERIK